MGQAPQRRIRKAVLPIAGMGTRFLPATKACPKEMMPIVDRPIVQWAAEEAWKAGIEHLIFVTGRGKDMIESHFDRHFELEHTLERQGKHELRDKMVAMTPRPGAVSFVRQQEPRGLGHAVWCARDLVGDEPFAILLPDVIIKAPIGCLSQMVELYKQVGGNVVGVERVDRARISSYGIVGVGERGPLDSFKITSMIEKPKFDDAPSNMALVGRYILQPEIFDLLEHQSAGEGGEIQLTDAMRGRLEHDDYHGFVFNGTSFDCGSKLGFLLANASYGLMDKKIGSEFRKALEEILAT